MIRPMDAAVSSLSVTRRILVSSVACLLAGTGVGFAQSFQENASWTNQHGSQLRIDAIAPNGSFSGSYVNRTGSCKDRTYPVTGWIDGQKISFTVRWANAAADCQGITSWTGYLGAKGVLTHWTFVHFNHSGNPVLTSGTDVFR